MHKVHNQIDYIEFPAKSVDELNKVKDFFNKAFGWSHTMYGDNFADTADSGTYSGVNAESPSPATLTVIYVSDLQESYEKVKATGVTITKEIFEFPGGKRFEFLDPAGNHLAAWSDK